MTILVAAGHGNLPKRDRGAVGNGIVEGLETLRLRDAVAENLRHLGFRPETDGVAGANDPLSRSIELAHQADIAIEFHFNSGPATASGVEVLATESRVSLAQQLAAAVATPCALPLRGAHGWRSTTSGHHSRLGFCDAGGLILEVCFLSNASDVANYLRAFPAIALAVAGVLASPPIAGKIGAELATAPRHVRKAFKPNTASTLMLPEGTELFRFSQEPSLKGPEVSPWWSPVRSLRPGDSGLAELERAAAALKVPIDAVGRAGLAVTRQWNSMKWLIVAKLTTPARAIVGRAAAQRFDLEGPANVDLIGGRTQAWIPGLRARHLRKM